VRKIHRRISQQARFGEAAGACVSQPDSWRWPAEVTPDQRVGTFPPGVHRWSDQAVAFTSSSLHSSTRMTFWTHTLVMFDICTDVYFDSHMSVRLSIVDTYVSRWPHWTLYIAIASVDRFYLNSVVCLQLDIALLIQNSVKIRRLSELWQCIQGVTFFLDTVYIFHTRMAQYSLPVFVVTVPLNNNHLTSL